MPEESDGCGEEPVGAPDREETGGGVAARWVTTIPLSPDTTIKSRTYRCRPRPQVIFKLTPHGTGESTRREATVAEENDSAFSDYEVLEMLGEGGMGVIHAARQTSIDRIIAIKMIRPELAEDAEAQAKFLAEAAVTGALDHPNIVPVHDLGVNEAGCLFYSMKRVNGVPWSCVIAEAALSQNLETLMKVSDAVAFAHSRGLIHRDLKPDNVMLGDFGEVLVMDWGLAASIAATTATTVGEASPIADLSVIGGTPSYMAPEMARGQVSSLGIASDVYLLGAILFEILSGWPPHTGESLSKCIQAAAENRIQRTAAKGELIDIAFKSMATLPEDRYAGVKEFQAALRSYRSHSESNALSARAAGKLANAKLTGAYDDYARALFLHEEALAMWGDNASARDGVRAARVSYAACAFEKHDLDLAASLLRATATFAPDAAASALARRIEAAREKQRDHKRIDNELNSAKLILANLLPKRLPDLPGIDLAVSYQSAREWGGDYYDFIPIAESGNMAFCIADSSNHGIAGSLMMGTMRTILRSMAARQLCGSDVLRELNAHLYRELKRGMFITCAYMLLDIQTRELSVTRAGHAPLLIWRASTRAVEQIRPGGMALGLDEGAKFNPVLKELKLQLMSGDRMLLYTDGVVDTANIARKLWGRPKLIEFMLEHEALSSSDFVHTLQASLAGHRGEAKQHDDVTIVTLRVL